MLTKLWTKNTCVWMDLSKVTQAHGIMNDRGEITSYVLVAEGSDWNATIDEKEWQRILDNGWLEFRH